jgi:hypothetical protein
MISLGPARMDVFVGLPDDEVLEVFSVDKQRRIVSCISSNFKLN